MEVTNTVLKIWSISEDTLFARALKNMQESRDYIMQAASSKIYELAVDSPAPENLLTASADAALDPGELFCAMNNLG